jgi:hypothetical protein
MCKIYDDYVPPDAAQLVPLAVSLEGRQKPQGAVHQVEAHERFLLRA